ncbi:uncharacterized protein PB18E9.04c-like isoform X2 [Daphnia pulex]|uniref:uncharacterized protein PB18E9.04c-like isoform X2 n=1 Tax=Daphnia pulex TaxID=6669 RepID=UPI001EE006BA|nr:uncharacterized protein PB18E9.04c-like isoform X2 [Daphnia pulex]
MASHHEPSQQRVPPPHDPPPAAVRPKPLWQPWSDSDDDRDLTSNRVGADNDGGGNKELPTRTKKERRRHERHHELLSTAARARKEIPVETADEVDRPLDMSTGRRASPPPYPAAGSSTGILPSYPLRYPSPPDYGSSSGPRPSVITCASSLRSSPAPSCPSPCGSTSSSASQSARTTTAGNGSPPPPPVRSRPTADGEARLPPQRREIISSGMCDPVIDEHFRRSLGERYTHLFASSSPSSSSSSTSNLTTTNDSSSRDGGAANKMPSTVNVTGLSVDDHFAKALGETWLKLQSETKEKEANTDSQPGSPLPSSAQRQGLLLT